jgi:hypothetical protein
MNIRDVLLLGVAIRCLDRSGMQIKSAEVRFGKRLRHDEREDSM